MTGAVFSKLSKFYWRNCLHSTGFMQEYLYSSFYTVLFSVPICCVILNNMAWKN